MIVKVQDLKRGDKVLIPFLSRHLRHAIVLRDPQISYVKDKITGVKKPRNSWRSDNIRYSAVKCSFKVEHHEKLWPATTWQKEFTHRWITYENSFEDHNYEKYVDLNGVEIWRIEE